MNNKQKKALIDKAIELYTLYNSFIEKPCEETKYLQMWVGANDETMNMNINNQYWELENLSDTVNIFIDLIDYQREERK